MPSVMKRKTSHVKPSSFAPYAGPEPIPGTYRARIKTAKVQKAKETDSLGYYVVAEFEADPARPHAQQYDGYPAFARLWIGDKEPLLQREQAFLLAVCGKADADIKLAGDPDKLKRGESLEIKSIGGKSPVDQIVLVAMQNERDDRTDPPVVRVRPDAIYPVRGATTADVVEAEEEAEDEDEDAADDELAEDYTEEELNDKSLPALRKILVEEFGQEEKEVKAIKGKQALVDAILSLQDEAEDEDADAEDEEDEDLEDTDDDEEDEEEDEDAEEAIRAEVEALTRDDVKKALKKYDVHKDRKFKSSETEDVLKEELIQLRLQEPPF